MATTRALQTDLITVNAPPAPVAAFSASAATGCAPLSVDFSDESLGDIDTWAWAFGDGGTSDVSRIRVTSTWRPASTTWL